MDKNAEHYIIRDGVSVFFRACLWVAIVVRSTIAIDKCRACASAQSVATAVAHSANDHKHSTEKTPHRPLSFVLFLPLDLCSSQLQENSKLRIILCAAICPCAMVTHVRVSLMCCYRTNTATEFENLTFSLYEQLLHMCDYRTWSMAAHE